MTDTAGQKLRHSATTVADPVETDMTSFEDSLERCVCHCFLEGAVVSWCGQIHRSEQPVHGVVEDGDRKLTEFCPWCGLRRCPDCKARIRRELRL